MNARDPEPPAVDVEPVLRMRGVSFRSDGVEILRELDLAVAPGEAVAITGSEGAGKTLLLRIAAGLARPEAGEVRLMGLDPWEAPANQVREARSRLGLVQQKQGFLANQTFRDNPLLPLRYHGRLDDGSSGRMEAWIRDLELAPYLDRFPADLPEGVRRRGALARALSQSPKLLLADHLLEVGTEASERIVARLEEARRSWNTAFVLTGLWFPESNPLAARRLLLEDGRLRPL